MRLKGAACLVLLGTACGQKDDPVSPPTVQTPLSGIVFLSQPAAGSEFEVREYLGGREGNVVAEGVADDEGRWTVDLGALSGDFIVRAMTMEGVELVASADRVGVGEGRTTVVSPVTHLVAAYARYLMSIGYASEEANLKARRLVHVHFGRIDHHAIEPHAVVAESGDRVMMLTPPVASGILLASFELLLEELAPGSTGAVLAALVEDVESDGLFDGRRDAEQLPFGLDGQTLRRRYAVAVRRFLESERNATVFGAADLSDVVEEIEQSQSELFPNGTLDGDQVGPAVSAFEIIGEGGTRLDPARGVRGRISVRASFEDPAGVTDARLETSDGVLLEDAALEVATVEAVIDTGTMMDGMRSFALVAIDGGGNITRRELILLVDNTAPSLSVEAPAISSSGRVTVTGTVSDEISGVDVVEVGIFGQPPILISDLQNGFSVVVPILCNLVEDIDVVARDRAGNELRTTVTAYCDDQAPQIQVVASAFVQEGSMVLELDASGGVVYSTAAAATTLDDQTAWPVRIEKYFNRLDDQSPNLPSIRFFVIDRTDSGAANGEVDVDFRYLVNGLERRASARFPRPSSGEPYEIPISYQSLGTDLAMAGRDALHRIEVGATDAAGNRATASFDFFVELLSPPVWMTRCDVANEVRNHTLGAANFHTIYGSGTETDVAEASLRYALDLSSGSLANGNGVLVEPIGIDVRTRILELNEDKFQEASSRNFMVGSIEELGQYCPFNTPGVYLNQAGANEHTRVFDQSWACVQGLYPDERTFSSGVLANDDAPHAASTGVVSQSGGSISPTGGSYAIVPDAPFTLRIAMRDPVVRLQGADYDWAQNPSAPTGYVATIANANARYRMPLALGRHHLGVDRWSVPNGGWAQQRSFETRSYVQRVEVATELGLTARHPSLPELEIEVRRDASCAGPVVYSSQL